MTLSVTNSSGGTQTIKTNDDIVGTAGTANANVLSVQGIASGTALAISAASLPLPSGAAAESGGNLAAAATSLGVMDDWDNAASTGCKTSGDIAHDAADGGEPQKIGAKAVTALSAVTLVSSGDRTQAYADLDGAIIFRRSATLGDRVNGNASNTDGASTSCIAAQGAGIKTYITDVTLTNTSSTNIYVEIKDGTTAKWTFPVPANGGVTHSFQSPLGGTGNTAWNFDPSAAATTVYCSMSGFKSAI